jgi:hypothetical protein
MNITVIHKRDQTGDEQAIPYTTTNFGALRNTMRVIKQHRRYLASVDCANDKFPIDICDVLEWNKGWSDELTQFEWNIVKAHLPS